RRGDAAAADVKKTSRQRTDNGTDKAGDQINGMTVLPSKVATNPAARQAIDMRSSSSTLACRQSRRYKPKQRKTVSLRGSESIAYNHAVRSCAALQDQPSKRSAYATTGAIPISTASSKNRYRLRKRTTDFGCIGLMGRGNETPGCGGAERSPCESRVCCARARKCTNLLATKQYGF